MRNWFLALAFVSLPAFAVEGLVALKSAHGAKDTELLIFGNPQGGTPFMECAQSVGIDLPLKALAGFAQQAVSP